MPRCCPVLLQVTGSADDLSLNAVCPAVAGQRRAPTEVVDEIVEGDAVARAECRVVDQACLHLVVAGDGEHVQTLEVDDRAEVTELLVGLVGVVEQLLGDTIGLTPVDGSPGQLGYRTDAKAYRLQVESAER
jgi:hypothetical protein